MDIIKRIRIPKSIQNTAKIMLNIYFKDRAKEQDKRKTYLSKLPYEIILIIYKILEESLKEEVCEICLDIESYPVIYKKKRYCLTCHNDNHNWPDDIKFKFHDQLARIKYLDKKFGIIKCPRSCNWIGTREELYASKHLINACPNSKQFSCDVNNIDHFEAGFDIDESRCIDKWMTKQEYEIHMEKHWFNIYKAQFVKKYYYVLRQFENIYQVECEKCDYIGPHDNIKDHECYIYCYEVKKRYRHYFGPLDNIGDYECYRYCYERDLNSLLSLVTSNDINVSDYCHTGEKIYEDYESHMLKHWIEYWKRNYKNVLEEINWL